MISVIDRLKDKIDSISYLLCMEFEGECVSKFDVLVHYWSC